MSESIIQAYRVFAMTATSKDLDNKLQTILISLPLDTQGKLVQSLELRGFFKTLESTFLTFLYEWMENCNRNGRSKPRPCFQVYLGLMWQDDWGLYGRVIQASIAIFNVNIALTHHILKTSNPPELLPPFNNGELNDSEWVHYGLFRFWLITLT